MNNLLVSAIRMTASMYKLVFYLILMTVIKHVACATSGNISSESGESAQSITFSIPSTLPASSTENSLDSVSIGFTERDNLSTLIKDQGPVILSTDYYNTTTTTTTISTTLIGSDDELERLNVDMLYSGKNVEYNISTFLPDVVDGEFISTFTTTKSENEDINRLDKLLDKFPIHKIDEYNDNEHHSLNETKACINLCMTVSDERQKVCSVSNTTHESDCHLNYKQCVCEREMDSCNNEQLQNLEIDYYGQCAELKVCNHFIFEEFLHRIYNWLSNAVVDWANNRIKTHNANDYPTRLANNSQIDFVAAYLFCIHDSNQNKIWDDNEIKYIVATFKFVEPCFVRFVQYCDKNDDNLISVDEWAQCLKIDHGFNNQKLSCF
ncbi:hypothetical protein GJ496_004149 [Pomphorhynchus laevis]|nr:hypothetical protein GJ496_004149 [Pomphorhynchus laevis]